MDKQQAQIATFMQCAGQFGTEETENSFKKLPPPSYPKIPDEKTRILRIRLLLEEVFEAAEAYGIMPVVTLHGWKFALLNEQIWFDVWKAPNIEKIADAHADIEYVNKGGAVACGIDLEPIFEAVHASNMTKFIDGYMDSGGKWVKGPSWKPADEDIKRIIQEQREEGLVKDVFDSYESDLEYFERRKKELGIDKQTEECKHTGGLYFRSNYVSGRQERQVIFECQNCKGSIGIPPGDVRFLESRVINIQELKASRQ